MQCSPQPVRPTGGASCLCAEKLAAVVAERQSANASLDGDDEGTKRSRRTAVRYKKDDKAGGVEPVTWKWLRTALQLRKVHLRGDGFCFGRMFMFLLSALPECRGCGFFGKAPSVEEKDKHHCKGGGPRASSSWVPTARLYGCAHHPPPARTAHHP